MSGMLRNVINWILRRKVDLDELTFKEYLELLEANGDEESLQLSLEMKEVARKVALFERNSGRTLDLSDIEVMKWKELKFRLSLMKEDILAQTEAFDFMMESIEKAQKLDQANNIGSGWDGAIIAT